MFPVCRDSRHGALHQDLYSFDPHAIGIFVAATHGGRRSRASRVMCRLDRDYCAAHLRPGPIYSSRASTRAADGARVAAIDCLGEGADCDPADNAWCAKSTATAASAVTTAATNLTNFIFSQAILVEGLAHFTVGIVTSDSECGWAAVGRSRWPVVSLKVERCQDLSSWYVEFGCRAGDDVRPRAAAVAAAPTGSGS